ncbi:MULTISPECIES: daptide-type RiPP biosynthesis aminotransferase [unclassified Microbacterium]|uniref:daptide-type RiPP biosynthesis aminotransferase n=1 Tax=unclassified Microbacterium TaxID=2609290 RepID=UPI00160518EE|nr:MULTISPECIES: daptide-type RiPP biosynthesis aminotransferase [unclassified Microbacterium]QNA93337.1 aspartate aminotransferase family protein [Microbacterium sp. Se63.02b]QYM63557.1 aminotransferase class III-fold pyridoxal phosphate-dependent enzyme [Microbacterium sp. Se5.02b]
MSAPHTLWTSMLPADSTFSPDRIAVGAAGHRIEFADGSTRLCATSGLWNVPLGFGNPAVAEAVCKATHDASYLSLFRAPHRYAEAAAEALIELANPRRYSRIIFSTSGGAANDAAMKLARQYWAHQGAGSRTIVVGLRGSYHGTMYGSHALSGDDLLQSAYSVDRRSMRHVTHTDDGDELETLLTREGSRVAAVVVEPVLGSGAYALSDTFIRRLLTLREQHGFLVVADEVATGFGRTGTMFATDGWEAAPDVLILSKALTNGVMGAAALLVGPRIASAFVRGGWTFVHGETQAGTPACAAAILAVIDELHRIDVTATTRALATELRDLAMSLTADGMVTEVTGRGCFVGLGLRNADESPLSGTQVLRVVSAIADNGVLVQPGPSAIELIPPYGFTASELRDTEAAVRAGLSRVREASV